MIESVVKKLEEAFAWGCTDTEACAYVDITPATLYHYQTKFPEFLEIKDLLKKHPIMRARKTVVEAIEKDPHLALKFLERKKKDEFGLRQEITGREGIPFGMDLNENIQDALKKVYGDRPI
jgi:hypothetical protein